MKTNYNERKQARLDNAKRLSEKNEDLQSQLFKRSHDLAQVIPFGQPILIGHHSEKRHRAHIEKVHNLMDKGVQAGKKADYYAAKAEAIENNTAISSDDPEALTKLKDKLEKLETWQQMMKDANKIIKNKKQDNEAKIAALIAMHIPEVAARKILEPDFAGRIGFASYSLTNNNANIKRTQDRIKQLEKISSMVTTEQEINGIKVLTNVEANRVQIFFPSIPDEEIRKKLKSHGYRWSPTERAWQRQISGNALYWAKQVLTEIPRIPTATEPEETTDNGPTGHGDDCYSDADPGL